LSYFNIKWHKPNKKSEVIRYLNSDGKIKSYSPDLFLEDFNLFLEIKGYWWGNDKRKMELVFEQHPNLKI